MNFKMKDVNSKGVNSVPYRPVRPKYTVPASKPVRITPMFRTRKNTERYKKKFFFFFFLSFLIFEFLFGQNDNLFALTY